MPKRAPSNFRTVLFVIVLCFVCASVLAVTATALRSRQIKAKELDTAKQMLQAARILDPAGYFTIKSDGEYVPARFDPSKKTLVTGEESDKAEPNAIYSLFEARLKPRLTDARGEIKTFDELGINSQEYIEKNQKSGYADLKWKLFYLILPNYSPVENPTGEGLEPAGYIIPVDGFGLWGPIYGYLALAANADSVIGASWYAPAETPGLGAIIQESQWLAQFPGKEVFQPSASGETDFNTARLGLTVVKGKVADVFGTGPRSKTSVDGITGATLTSNGVTNAYKETLAAYRPFLVKVAEEGK